MTTVPHAIRAATTALAVQAARPMKTTRLVPSARTSKYHSCYVLLVYLSPVLVLSSSALLLTIVATEAQRVKSIPLAQSQFISRIGW